ncbi:hypothetical protein AAC387_Pa10g1111 [Persea americana]
MLKEFDTKFNCLKMPVRQWTDLPLEILELIFNQLLLVEFLAFRGVCKAWRLATFACCTTMAQTMEQKPWILFYRDSDDPDTSPWCCLYNESSKKTYTVKIPEVEGASCIASKEGWLLVHRHGHVFFFNPFSRVKIDLPEFSYKLLSCEVATFSSLPTKKDCTVFVISRIDPEKLEVSTCCWGDREWTKHTWDGLPTYMKTIRCATFSECEGLLYIMDPGIEVVTFDLRHSIFERYKIVYPDSTTKNMKFLPFRRNQNHFKLMMKGGPDLRSWLSKSNEKDQSKSNEKHSKSNGKKKQSISFATCGTSMKGGDYHWVIPCEQEYWELEVDTLMEKIHVKAVWVKPCFAQLSPESDYRWTT